MLRSFPERGKMSAELKDLVDRVNATLGKDAVQLGAGERYKVTYIQTGLLPIDILLMGGMPRGRFVEIFGDYSTLKSYIALNVIRQVQLEGGTAALIDTEHAFEPAWAEALGIDTENLIVEHPETGELAMDLIETLVRGGIDFIALDSIAATLPASEAEKRLHGEKVQPGRLAYLMSTGLRRVNTANSRTSILMVNQTRQNIGITFGSNEALPGGKAMPYYASMRIAIRKTGKITRDVKMFDGEKWAGSKEQIGQRFKAEILKSKLSKPFRDVWFTWNLETGQIDIPTFLFTHGVELGFVSKSGNTWSVDDKKAVGKGKFLDMLTNDQDLMLSLEYRIREHHGLPQTVDTEGYGEPKKKSGAKKSLGRKKR